MGDGPKEALLGLVVNKVQLNSNYMFSKQSYTGAGIVQPTAVSQVGQNLARGIEKFGQGIGQAFESSGESKKLRRQLLTFSDEFKPDDFQGTDSEWSKMFANQLEDTGLPDLKGMMDGGMMRKSIQMLNEKIEGAKLQNQQSQQGITQAVAQKKFNINLFNDPNQSVGQAAQKTYEETGAIPSQALTMAQDQRQANILGTGLGVDVEEGASAGTVAKVFEGNLAKQRMEADKKQANIDRKYKRSLIRASNTKREQALSEMGKEFSKEQLTRLDSVYDKFIDDERVDAYIKGEGQFKQLQDVVLQPDATGASALATIFSFMKSLDPESIVRESEQDQARKTGGLFDSIVGSVNNLAGGGALTPSVRKNILDVSRKAIESQAKIANEYRLSVIDRQGQLEPDIDSSLYVPGEFNPGAFDVYNSRSEIDKAFNAGQIEVGQKVFYMTDKGFKSLTGGNGNSR